jgi:hypothetical protein
MSIAVARTPAAAAPDGRESVSSSTFGDARHSAPASAVVAIPPTCPLHAALEWIRTHSAAFAPARSHASP